MLFSYMEVATLQDLNNDLTSLSSKHVQDVVLGDGRALDARDRERHQTAEILFRAGFIRVSRPTSASEPCKVTMGCTCAF